jgi:hypothetical protein
VGIIPSNMQAWKSYTHVNENYRSLLPELPRRTPRSLHTTLHGEPDKMILSARIFQSKAPYTFAYQWGKAPISTLVATFFRLQAVRILLFAPPPPPFLLASAWRRCSNRSLISLFRKNRYRRVGRSLTISNTRDKRAAGDT